jgi:hypothetical protein
MTVKNVSNSQHLIINNKHPATGKQQATLDRRKLSKTPSYQQSALEKQHPTANKNNYHRQIHRTTKPILDKQQTGRNSARQG